MSKRSSWVVLAVCLSACSRTETTGRQAVVVSGPGSPAKPDAAARADTFQVRIGEDEGPRLELRIVKVYEQQKPLDHAPWHADGGDWLFFDGR